MLEIRKVRANWKWQRAFQEPEVEFHSFRPHRRTTYVDAAYFYRPSSVVRRSVCLSVCHNSEPCKNGSTDRDKVHEDSGGPKEPVLDASRVLVPGRSPMGRGNLEGDGRPIVKYRDALLWAVQKRLNQSWCRLGWWLGVSRSPRNHVGLLDGVHILMRMAI